MTATPFSLVSAEDPGKIFAYGLDIDLPSGRRRMLETCRSGSRKLTVLTQRGKEAAPLPQLAEQADLLVLGRNHRTSVDDLDVENGPFAGTKGPLSWTVRPCARR